MYPSPVVMVIDDDAAVRALLTATLQPRGYTVLEVASGEEGLALLEQASPRLIVLDYFMPGLDGAGFLMEMSAWFTKRPPVLLLTTADDDPRVVRELGVEVQVEKPIEAARFAMIVDAMVRGAGVDAHPEPVERISRRERAERRAHVRRKLSFQVEVRAVGTGPLPVSTLDWSLGGVSLAMPLAPRAGSYLSVSVVLPGGRRVELDARVRYVGGGRVGAQFFALDRTRRLALETIIDS